MRVTPKFEAIEAKNYDAKELNLYLTQLEADDAGPSEAGTPISPSSGDLPSTTFLESIASSNVPSYTVKDQGAPATLSSVEVAEISAPAQPVGSRDIVSLLGSRDMESF